MRNLIKILPLFFFLATFVFPAGCGKEKFSIGRENPEQEIQKCMKLSEKKKFEEAIECLEIFKSRFPQTNFSTEAELAIGDNYFNKKEYLLAADAYKTFTNLHPNSPKADYAHYRLGLSYLKESPKAIDRDQQYLDDAILYLRMATINFPNSPYHQAAIESLKDARSRVARRNYYIGRFYYRTGEYRAAIPRFLEVISDYPESEVAPEALYNLVVATCKIKLVNDAKLFYSKLAVDYPASEWTKKAESKLSSYVKKYGDNAETGDNATPKESPGGTNDPGR